MATRSPFFTPKRFQRIRELLYFSVQLLVGKNADFARLTLPDDCSFVLAPGLNVPVEAVVGKINLSAHEPFGPRTIPVQDLIPLLEPVQLTRDARPELVGIFDRLFI